MVGGKVPFLTHTAVAIPAGERINLAFGKEYFWSGVCHQEVARALGVIPTQLFPTRWDVYFTYGIYGAYGGSGALPAYLMNQYIKYRRW
jgi:hypothetical protein